MQTSENAAPNAKVNLGVISEAVGQFKGNAGTWILAALIYLIIVIGLEQFTNRITGIATSSSSIPAMMQFFIPIKTSMMSTHPILIPISLVAYVIDVFLAAGLYKMATKKIRGNPFSIRDLVNISSSKVPSIIAFAIMTWIITTCGQLALSHLWLQSVLHPQSSVFRTWFYVGLALHILIDITWGGLLMFTLPLIVDQQMNLIDAISKSFTTLKHQWLTAIPFYAVIEIITVIGLLFCLVGALFTVPIAILSVTVLYRNFFIGSSSPPPPIGKKLFEPAIPPGS